MEITTVLALLLGTVIGGGLVALIFARRARAIADAAQMASTETETLRRDLAVAAALTETSQAQLADAAAAQRNATQQSEQSRSEYAENLDQMRVERSKLDQELVAANTMLTERNRQGEERDQRLRIAAEELRARDAMVDSVRVELGEAKTTCAKLQQLAADFAARESEIVDLREKVAIGQERLGEKSRLIAVLEQQVENDQRLAEEKLNTLRVAQAEMQETFKGIAAQVLQQNTEKFEANTKIRLVELLQPLGERIKEFETKVQDTHKRDIEDRSVLHAEIKRVVSASQKLDQDAVNLTKALKGDAQAQGAWGEVVLERILEQSGLREGTEYVRQATLKDDNDRRQRPDVIVHLPGQRDVVVDAKVSLTAYEAYCSSTNDDERVDLLAAHIASVRSHVKELSDKEYWRLAQVHTPDFVLMFIPIEPAFIEALRCDPGLFDFAFQKRIVLASPTTLLAVLKTIEHAWQVERHNESAREIVRQAGALYDKLRGFVVDLQEVGSRLGQAQTAYDGALGKLSMGKGNVISRAKKLEELGVKVKQQLPDELVEREQSIHALSDEVTDSGAAPRRAAEEPSQADDPQSTAVTTA